MKKFFISLSILLLASCATKKASSETGIKQVKNITQEVVYQETTQIEGTEYKETLSEDGTKIEKVPYRWFAGTAEANDRQTAIEMAQREAYATISRVLENIVLDQAERGTVANNGNVQKALTSHWKQVSNSVTRGCEPYGNVVIEYSTATGMYIVTAKVGIKGERFYRLLNDAGKYRPNNLNEDELNDFIEINEAIMNAAKSR